MQDDPPDERVIGDHLAVIDDIEHARLCMSRLKECWEEADPTCKRALWNSALISLRRALVNGATMVPGAGGKQETPFTGWPDAKQALPEDLQEKFERFLKLSDSMVAHRTPLDGARSIDVNTHGSGGFTATGTQMLPTKENAHDLENVAHKLRDEAMQRLSDRRKE